jgi:membrane-associated phospholipid phosphatase
VYAFDRIVIGYCLLMVLLIGLFGRPFGQYVGSMAFYAGMAGVAAIIIRFFDVTRNRWHAFLRLLYPAIMFTFFYRQTGGLMFLIFPEFFDWQLVTFETMLFGIEPTLYIDRRLLNVWLNELFSLCYFAYYPMLPAFLLPVFLRRDDDVLKEFLAAACLMFFASYLLFFLYPAEGPRWFQASQYQHAIEGPVFRQWVNLVIAKGAVHGGAMPSSHTGIAVVILLFCFRYYRKCGWAILPVVLGLAIGTFWGRFHYVSDTVAGALLAFAAVGWVWRSRSQKSTPAQRTTSENSRHRR